MKSLLFSLLLTLLINSNGSGQPQAIPFQGAARNASGNILANRNISLRLSVIDSTVTGPVIYSETHSTTTSLLGLFTVNVGQGTVVSGAFDQIPWGAGDKYLSVELDTNNGSAYVTMGVTQMLSVPYALYAKASGTKIGFSSTIIPDTLPAGVQNILQLGTISYNHGNGLDSTGFTAPETGLYHFNVSIFWTAFPACTPVNVLLIKNSTVADLQRDYFCTGSVMNSKFSDQLYLLAGEKVNVGVIHYQAFTPNSISPAYTSVFSGYKVY